MALGTYTSLYCFKTFHSFQHKLMYFHDKKSRMKTLYKNQKPKFPFTSFLQNHFPNLKASAVN